ncbi:MAG: cobalt-precorrin 5A hydrolase [Lachnospiraceae bacterium]|nr:cobalt-precorrin 5A hydrolase [Lachnospiraceae bacterium]MBQ1648797.1 cobalt-precorrin 5A hydrolase [Bacteroidales bacterium]
MKTAIACFSDAGMELGKQLKLGEVTRIGEETGVSLDEWTKEHFETTEGLIFIGACGIAVRAIAPYLVSKTTDPAVVVVDDMGTFVISLVSGHLGGANDLASMISSRCGAVPVITTATDQRGTFAVDQWAKREGIGIVNPEAIKEISSSILAGNEVVVSSGSCKLHLVPKLYVLGVGCKKDTSPEAMIEAYQEFAKRYALIDASIGTIATIDLKKEELAIRVLSKRLGVPVVTFGAEELAAVSGDFTASEFVEQITGVDNVCERAAVRMAGGTLMVKKESYEGITFALARNKRLEQWSWE